MADTTDVQSQMVEHRFRITRVGVTGVKKPIVVERPSGRRTLNATIDVFVDLPYDQKGSHMSRNVEVTGEVVDKSVREPVKGLENLAADMCDMLLDRHEYASYSEVDIKADYFLEKESPKGRRSLESYKIRAKGEGYRKKDDDTEREIMKFIGATVVGINACPCAMETVKDEYKKRYPKHTRALEELPTITHNQRNKSTLMVEVPNDKEIEVNDIIEILESSVSSPTHEILKREDEAEVVMQAHENPKFVEDIVRDVLSKCLDKYHDYPDSAHIEVKSKSEESIHKHDAFAERVTTFGELRK